MNLETHYVCPVCKQPLLAKRNSDGWEIWCGSGNCESEVSNDGAEGSTLKEAMELFLEIIEAEEQRNEAL